VVIGPRPRRHPGSPRGNGAGNGECPEHPSSLSPRRTDSVPRDGGRSVKTALAPLGGFADLDRPPPPAVTGGAAASGKSRWGSRLVRAVPLRTGPARRRPRGPPCRRDGRESENPRPPGRGLRPHLPVVRRRRPLSLRRPAPRPPWASWTSPARDLARRPSARLVRATSSDRTLPKAS
jgi:hypothetical protein